jgi:hypothetical protein
LTKEENSADTQLVIVKAVDCRSLLPSFLSVEAQKPA